jgi:hypothetical protein
VSVVCRLCVGCVSVVRRLCVGCVSAAGASTGWCGAVRQGRGARQWNRCFAPRGTRHRSLQAAPHRRSLSLDSFFFPRAPPQLLLSLCPLRVGKERARPTNRPLPVNSVAEGAGASFLLRASERCTHVKDYEISLGTNRMRVPLYPRVRIHSCAGPNPALSAALPPPLDPPPERRFSAASRRLYDLISPLAPIL